MNNEQNPITIIAGATARQKLRDHGWDPSLFTTMVGASGGPKLLGIAGLDQFLFGDFLQRSDQPMHLIGSSIGSWRHAALASPDPVERLGRLHDYYLRQSWDTQDKRPARQVIDDLCEWVMDNTFDDKALPIDLHPPPIHNSYCHGSRAGSKRERKRFDCWSGDGALSTWKLS